MRPSDIARLMSEEALPVEFEEANGTFEFNGEEYPHWGSPTGRSSTTNYEKGKFNRYAKLGHIADEVIQDLVSIVNQDHNSVDGRCAYACLIMMSYGVRVGNEDSAEGYESGMKDNKGEIVHTYGTTTLLNKHVNFKGEKLLLNFVGKEQVKHYIKIKEPFLVGIGKLYWDARRPNDPWLGIDYESIFKFIKSKIGDAFVPKDMRTFCGNTTGWKAIEKFLDKPKHEKKSDAKKEVKQIVEIVAKRLGNTPGIAKKNYIDNRMLDWFLGQRYIEPKD